MGKKADAKSADRLNAVRELLEIVDAATDLPRFDLTAGNPPYQMETSAARDNTQATTINVFPVFQDVSTAISETTSMIYPGGRWIQRGGKGMSDFADRILNSKWLQSIFYFKLKDPLYPFTADIQDGVSIVYIDSLKSNNGRFLFNGIECLPPGESILPLDSKMASIVQKVRQPKMRSAEGITQKMFSIESNWIEKNPGAYVPVMSRSESAPEFMIDPIKVLTNDKAGKAGRPKWFWVERSVVLSNAHLVDKWQFAIKSAQFAHETTQIENGLVIAPGEAFGRSKISLANFDTKDEVQNFRLSMLTNLFTKLYRESLNGGLTYILHFVPDLEDYTNKNELFGGLSTVEDSAIAELNERLMNKYGLTEEEVAFIDA